MHSNITHTHTHTHTHDHKYSILALYTTSIITKPHLKPKFKLHKHIYYEITIDLQVLYNCRNYFSVMEEQTRTYSLNNVAKYSI